MKSDSDIYINILKYGRDNPGFTFNDISGHFPTKGQLIWNEMKNSRLFLPIESGEDILDGELALSFEDRFRLLEYEELQEARQSSRRAMYIAIGSLLLSMIVTLLSFFVVQKVELISPKNAPQPTMKIGSEITTQ
ncbi:MAG: hypothetical protein HQ556_01790 [Candidatus Marinimicrobia bacterium]|nr:hypothetical protein [Candidatus Neomarinimicrobiota bacterium]